MGKTRTLKTKLLCLATASVMVTSLLGGGTSVQAASKKTTAKQATAETYYASELTGLPISTSLRNQRPIAVMVDNEKTALVHFGTSEADIVYEMMNSTANGRITRLMCIYKDYNNIPMIGSIRSIRPTNLIISGEYNAVCVHDGGPYYINDWVAKEWTDNLSAGFTRVNNGKKREFTEYVAKGEVKKRLAAKKISADYTNSFLATRERESHFLFNPVETLLSVTYANAGGALPATNVNLSNVFPHNKSMLKYNSLTMTYDYYEYGSLHIDGEDSLPLTFKNVILQETSFAQLDNHGYLIYNVIGSMPSNAATGYYLTDGQMIPIIWIKNGETAITHYFDLSGKEISINPGKTYIGIIPSDTWDKVAIN